MYSDFTSHNQNIDRKIRVLDLINTDRSAKELLDHRVAQVNQSGIYENSMYCSSGEYVERLREKGHTVHVVETPRGLSPVGLIVAIWETYRLFRRHRFDIIHLHGSVIGLIGRIAAFFARTPIVVYQVHGFHFHSAMPKFNQWIYTKIEQTLSCLTDKLLFQNQKDLDECRRRKIAPEYKLALVGNGIQLNDFAFDGKPNNNPPVILYVGRFEFIKNHPMLFEAVEILKNRQVPFVLQLAGDGDLRPAYEKWVLDHRLTEQIVFLGYCDDVPQLIANADVCVLVSIKEGLPRVIIEAAAAGRPMIATDVVGNRDTLVNGETGFLVPLNNPVALADRLERLLGDPELQNRIGQQARIYARQHFDEQTITKHIIAIYDQLVENLNKSRGNGGE
jgi:glycosyltransferase involved in cell wall biosynthesis